MSLAEPEQVKRKAPPDADSTWDNFPLDGTVSNPSVAWSPSQVQDEQVDQSWINRLAQSVNITEANVVINLSGNCDMEKLRSLLRDYGERNRSPIDDRRAGNSRRRAQVTDNRRHSATRRGNVEGRTYSRGHIPRRSEYNRRDHGHSDDDHQGTSRHYREVPREQNAHSGKPPTRKNSFHP